MSKIWAHIRVYTKYKNNISYVLDPSSPSAAAALLPPAIAPAAPPSAALAFAATLAW